MKTLVAVAITILGTLFLIILASCDNPIQSGTGQSDNVAQLKSVESTILVVDNYESRIFKYEKIFSDGVFLNITFPECDSNGCGIAIELSSITYYETFK